MRISGEKCDLRVPRLLLNSLRLQDLGGVLHQLSAVGSPVKRVEPHSQSKGEKSKEPPKEFLKAEREEAEESERLEGKDDSGTTLEAANKTKEDIC